MIDRQTLMLTAIVIAGLSAGLLFGWMVSVIPGLKGVDDRTYVSTMQSINVRIINPWFVIPFLITPALLAGAGFAEYRAGNQRRAWQLAVATLTYLSGVLGVTFGGNIPLNNSLDSFVLADATPTGLAAERAGYEGPWNRWHLIRTVASGLAFAMAASAAIVGTEPG